ncbi:MAG: type II secretion system F family protein [Sphaerobacteraceae bacterium]|nr:MAG: type II secretion system F family protein [Sphaerobacteraceae bacterium]
MGGEVIAIAIILMIIISLGLVVVGYRRANQDIVIEERLTQYGHREVSSLTELELEQPFQDRVVFPVLRRLSRLGRRFTPRSAMEGLRQQLVEAGSPSGIGPAEYLGIRVATALSLSGVVLLMFLLGGADLLLGLGLSAFMLLLGYMLPGYWLKSRISARRKSVQQSLPDAIDLLTISVESGLGFDPALARVIEKWDNELTREFGRMLSEIRMGKSRREAMRELSQRVNVDDLNVFVSSMIQADQLGVSISQVLRVQSKQMRLRRRQRAEEQAHKAPVKMLFPMVFLIFPALYIVLLGPAIPRILDAF